MALLSMILEFMWNALQISIMYIFILFGPGLIFAFLLHYLHHSVEKSMYTIFGQRLYLILFGWLGTILHEVGHAIMCPIFGHTINEIQLFKIDPVNKTLGYVKHSYNPKSVRANIGRFFIGIGPLLLGSIVLYYAAYFLVSETFFSPLQSLHVTHLSFMSIDSIKYLLLHATDSFIEMTTQHFTWNSLLEWRSWVFLYLLFSVGSSMTLSRADSRGAIHGLIAMVGIFFIISSALLLTKGAIQEEALLSITRYYSVFYSVMLLSIMLNGAMAFPLYGIRKLRGG